MPNIILTSNARFSPFTFDEMLKLPMMNTQAHQAIEEAYSELDSQANAIGSLANETDDPITYARYKSFEDSLRSQADALAKNGLTPGSRKSLLDLKGRYYEEITPIQNAITRRRALADEQRKALLQNPTLMYQRNLNVKSRETSLDRFLENPDYDYGQQYSGALLTQQVSQAASNLAKELTSYGNGKRLDAYTKTFMQHHGFTREQVLDAINNPNRAASQPVLNAIVEQVIGSSGMSNWADTPTMNKAYNYARQGLWSAIGQTNVSPYEDYGARMALQDYYRRKNNNLTGDYPNNPIPIISSRAAKEATDNINNFKQYFYKDKNGHWKMNTDGLKAYHRPQYMQNGPNIKGEYVTSDFKRFIDSIGGAKYIISVDGKLRMQPGNLGNLFSQYIENSKKGKGMMRTEYITDIKGSDQADFKTQVMRAARAEGKLYGSDINDKTDLFEATGDDLSLKDLASDDYAVVSEANSAYPNGRTLFVLNKTNGEIKRYKAPAGIHYTAENSSTNALHNMKTIEETLMSGTLNGKPLTEAQITFLNNLYRQNSNMYGMINSQIGMRHDIPTVNNNPSSW